MLEHLREAETLCEQLNDDRRRGRVCTFMTTAHTQLGELDEALVTGTRALEIAGRLGDLRLRIPATTQLEFAHHNRADYERVVALATDNLAALPADLVHESFGGTAPASVHDRNWLMVRRPTPYQVRDIGERLTGQLGGVPSLPAIVSAVRSETGCSRATAYRAIRDCLEQFAPSH